MTSSDVLVASLQRVVDDLGPTYQRLLDRRKIPSCAEATRILPEHFPSILELHAAVFATSAIEVRQRLFGTSKSANYCLKRSTVLLSGAEVMGTTLVLAGHSLVSAYVYAIIVGAPHRRSWATAYLKLHSLTHLLSEGFERIAFQALAGNPDTLNHARKVGAEKLIGDLS